MRILQVLHNYPPEFRGGVERAVEQSVAALVALGHKVDVLCGSESVAGEAQARVEQHQGVQVLRLIREDLFRTPADPFDPGIVPLYEQALGELRPDVVHIHHWWNLSDDLARRAVAMGIPAVLTLHDSFSSCSLFFRMPDGCTPCELPQSAAHCGPCLYSKFGVDESELGFLADLRATSFRAEAAAAAVVLAPSHAHALALARHSGISVPEILPLGTEPLLPLPPRGRAFPQGPLRVLHFGNLSKLKGVELLARAVELADPEGSAIELVLAGDVVESPLFTGRAHIAPRYSREELRALAATADVAVFPSLARETYGLVVDEALHLRLPLIVSNRGALSERIGARGFALSVDSPEPLAAALRSILADPTMLQRYAHAPAPVLETPQSHAAKLVRIYERARQAPLPTVDTQSGLLRRIERNRRRVHEIAALLQRLRGG
ncbi:MAG: glycosyltransferase [Planctomycetes bacterium]|nr:glycosyltransferase [Planctomycetota bacterium]